MGTTTGAKLKKVIDSVSAPHDAEDTRTGSQRRVQGLDDLLSRILGEGLPSDKGVRPHMSVFVDAETLQAAAEHVKQATQNPGFVPEPMPPVEPARLAGHGAIGPNLLMYFLCISDFTAFLMKEGDGDRQAQVLNAGRDRYQPNILQRRSVIARQEGVCAPLGRNHRPSEARQAPGEASSDGVAGAASAASRAPHHVLHRGRLHISGDAVDGFRFTNRTGRPLRRRRRAHFTRAA